MTFIIYTILRLFARNKQEYLEGDEVRHLGTAKTFYRFWNKSFYDFHPPLYSLLIKWFATIGGYPNVDVTAGVLVSFISSLGLYWVSSQLFLQLGLSSSSAQIALTFLAFNYVLIYYSNRVFRYQLFCLLFTTATLMLVTHHFAWCGVFWGLSALTCSFGGLRFFWVWLPYSLFVHISPLPPIIFSALYGIFWLFPKALCYSSADYHPSGPEGKLEPVRSYNFKQLISPMYFPYNYKYYGSKGFEKDWSSIPKNILSLFLPVKHYKLLILPALVMFVLTYWGMFNSFSWLTISTLCLLWTTTYTKFNPRNCIVVLPYLAYFFAKFFGIGLKF